MTEELKVKLIGKLLTADEISKELKLRKLDSYNESYPNESAVLKEKLLDDWQIKAELKTTTKIFKPKNITLLLKINYGVSLLLWALS